MVVLLSGKDAFRLHLALQERIAQLRTRYGSGLAEARFAHPESSANDIRSALRDVPLFASHVLVICRNALRDEEFCNLVRSRPTLFEQEGKTILVTHEGEALPKHAASRALAALGEAASFGPLSKKECAAWIGKEVRRLQATASDDALLLIADWCRGDVEAALNAVRLLASFRGMERIRREDASRMLKSSEEGNMFAVIESAVSGSRSRALELLFLQREAGDDPLRILSMMAYQVRLLVEARDALDRKAPLPGGFAYKKAGALAKRFRMQDLIGLHDRLYAIDRAVKTGTRPAGDALEEFVLGL